jgi:hypothetical protein
MISVQKLKEALGRLKKFSGKILNLHPAIGAASRATLFLFGAMYLMLALIGLIGLGMQYIDFYKNYDTGRMQMTAYVAGCEESGGACGISEDDIPTWEEYAAKERPLVTWEGRKKWVFYFLEGVFLVMIARFLRRLSPKKTKTTGGDLPQALNDRQKELTPGQLAGLFLTMAGSFILLAGAYFMYDWHATGNGESLGYTKPLFLISGLLILTGIPVLCRLPSKIKILLAPKEEKSTAAAGTSMRYKLAGVLIWIFVPIAIWTALGGPIPYFGIRPPAPNADMPTFGDR